MMILLQPNKKSRDPGEQMSRLEKWTHIMWRLGRLLRNLWYDSKFLFIYNRVKKTRGEGKKCHAKTMMSRKVDR
jgi:hypothetical protein